ncbi:unnamed protein product [Microthlaspi erraticum]|uniref:Uncharacterized protein n=1 Tax=Microthlaspi erraticum TaxID=1685480 RepID=A0A6D2JC00_9BRAS|nr:unnamed protein product [Microthlaspi erraticum]
MERDEEEDAYIVDSVAMSGQQRSGETGVEKRRTSRARESVGEDDIRTKKKRNTNRFSHFGFTITQAALPLTGLTSTALMFVGATLLRLHCDPKNKA